VYVLVAQVLHTHVHHLADAMAINVLHLTDRQTDRQIVSHAQGAHGMKGWRLSDSKPRQCQCQCSSDFR
jgi:hypothetical protein